MRRGLERAALLEAADADGRPARDRERCVARVEHEQRAHDARDVRRERALERAQALEQLLEQRDEVKHQLRLERELRRHGRARAVSARQLEHAQHEAADPLEHALAHEHLGAPW